MYYARQHAIEKCKEGDIVIQGVEDMFWKFTGATVVRDKGELGKVLRILTVKNR